MAIKSILLLGLFTALTCSAKAQKLMEDPNNIQLKPRYNQPLMLDKSKISSIDDVSITSQNPLNEARLLGKVTKGDVYELADGMKCLVPVADVPRNNQMPGTSSTPTTVPQVVNPIPNLYAPQLMLPKSR